MSRSFQCLFGGIDIEFMANYNNLELMHKKGIQAIFIRVNFV